MSETRTMKCPKCGAENYSWRSRCQTCNTLLQEDTGINITPLHRATGLWTCALIAGLLGGVGATVFMWLIFAFAKGRITDPMGWLIVIGTGLFALGGVAIAWKWPLIGGVMLIVGGLALIGLYVGVNVWTGIQSGFGYFLRGLLYMLIPSLPLLASGILFLLSWREGRRHL